MSTEATVKTIVFLGNVKHEAENTVTRHQAGFLTANALAKKLGEKFLHREDLNAYVLNTTIEGLPVLLVKPAVGELGMNESGEVVRDVIAAYDADAQNVLVVYDDLDLPLVVNTETDKPSYCLKFKAFWTPNSLRHNGVSSLTKELPDDSDFALLRVGVGRKPAGADMLDFVLGQLSEVEAEHLKASTNIAADAVCAYVTQGIDAAMRQYN